MKASRGFRRYLGNVSWVVTERVFRILVSFGVTILMARYLGPDRFGVLNYAVSFAAIFSGLSTVGLDQIVVRELVLHDRQAGEILGTALFLRLISSLIMTGVAVSVAFLVSRDLTANLMIMLLCLSSLFQAAGVIDWYFQAKVLSRFVVRVQLISVMVSGLATAGLVFLGLSVLWFVLPKIAESFTLCAGLIYVFSRNVGPLRGWKAKMTRAKDLLRDSWPLVLTGIFIGIYMRTDQVMIKYFMGDTAVGYYAVAVRLCEAWYFLPMAVVTSLFPAIVSARKADTPLYHRRLQNLYDLMTWLAVAIAVPMSFFSKDLIKLLFGAQYLESYGILVLYVWTGVFVFQGVVRSKWIVAENLQIYGFWFAFCSAVVNIALNLVLIPLMGLLGAALATVISQCATVVVFPLFFEKTRRSSLAILASFDLVRVIGKLASRGLYAGRIDG
ncbi:MAG: flippase [Deltaproteobacteria bacterium]|nr:flippase [Deltaproteobacteria bacterium]